MKTNYEIRYAAHPEDVKSYDTKRIRRDFLIGKVFFQNKVSIVYSMYGPYGGVSSLFSDPVRGGY